MIKQLLRCAGPIVPILYVDANVNQARTTILLKKLRRFRYDYAKGIAIVCSIQNCMPVQIDKIFQEISRIREQHKIPVYGFLLDKCTPENYYMASVADQVYSLQSTIFQLSRNQTRISWDDFLLNYKIKKFTIKSNQNLSGANLDKYTSANTSHIGNKKQTEISQRMYAESISNRIKNAKNNTDQLQNISLSIPEKIPKSILGNEALQLGIIDKLGQHYQILQQKHPGCYFPVIKYVEQPLMIKRSFAVLTSPILLALFLFKVFLKWSLIMYVWIKSKKDGKNKTIQEAQAQVQAGNS